MQPTFVLSLDEELMWGTARTSEREFERGHPDVRGVANALLALFDRHGISATWAILGRLCADETPSGYGRDLLAAIEAARTPQEIASHSFSHVAFAKLSRVAAAQDLSSCALASRAPLRSFVFPYNREAHHDLLASHGFTAYRGRAPTWYARAPGALQRAAHLLDQSLALTPPVVRPYERLPGLWNIPASMLFLHREGVRRFVALSARVRKAKRGIDQAIATQSLFHLWFHPFNMCADRAGMFAALEEILAYVVQSGIAIRTMGGLAAELAQDSANRGAALAPLVSPSVPMSAR